jgi:hypothetical protein
MLRTIAMIVNETEDTYPDLDIEETARDWAATNGVQIVAGQFVYTEDEFAAFTVFLEQHVADGDEEAEEEEEDGEEEEEENAEEEGD